MNAEDIKIIPNVDRNGYISDLGVQAQYKGADCEVVIINNELSKRANRLNLILQDLELCLEYLSLQNTPNESLQSAIHRAFVITYGKCFATANHRKMQLHPKHVFVDTPEIYSTIHQQLIDMRNDFVAHSGDQSYEDSQVQVILPPPGSEGLKPALLHSTRAFRSFYPVWHGPVRRVVEHVRTYVENKRLAVDEKIKNQAFPD